MMIRSGEKLGEEKLSLGCPSRIQERQCGRRKKGFERWMKVERCSGVSWESTWRKPTDNHIPAGSKQARQETNI